MNVSQRYQRLLEFMYDKYQTSATLREAGEFPWPLADEFERESGVDLGDGASQLEAIRFLAKEGWVEISTKTLSPASRVHLTRRGMKHVEDSRALSRKLMGPLGNLAELIGRFWKGRFGE